MSDIVRGFDDLPWIVKLIFALPGFDVLWGIYRLIKGIDRRDNVLILSGIVWIATGWALLWIIDLYTVLMYKKVTVLA